jgi:hypothetical protein
MLPKFEGFFSLRLDDEGRVKKTGRARESPLPVEIEVTSRQFNSAAIRN